ncbi:MAG: PEGA domain-containing protein [Deltaproteobacteria bacterium]|nr:PEGA domain-containing protein [Deltaproteobacteria bacterium]
MRLRSSPHAHNLVSPASGRGARSARQQNDRLLVVAFVPLLALACGTTTQRRGAQNASAQKHWVVVGLAHDVDARAPVVAELVKALSVRARVEVVKAAKRVKVVSAERAVKKALTRGRQLYLQMQMEEATEQLERALDQARVTFARGLTSKDLAQLHLHLAAVRYARQRMGLFQRHCRAAIAYDPKLSPNADLFSPPVRKCIEDARSEQLKHEIEVVVHPANATLILDGVRQGSKPLGAQFAGEHFLRVEHPLYQTWGRVLHLSAKAHLEVRLRPVLPPVIMGAALAQPSLAKEALPLLGAHALVLLHKSKDGASVAMRALGPHKELTRVLSPATPLAQLTSSAEGIVGIAGVSPRAEKVDQRRASSQPTSQPMVKRSLWKSPWLWGAVAAGVLVAVIVPLSVSGSDSPVVAPAVGRPVRLELPW